MEEKIIVDKEYSIPYELFCNAYNCHMKKNVYPKSYLFMGIFIVIAVVYIIAAFKDPSNLFSYVLIFLCLGFAFREWYNPRKIRRNIVDTVKAMGEPVYKLEMTENFIYISTLGEENVENSDSAEELPEEDNSAEMPSEEFAQPEVIDTETYDDAPERTAIEITSEVSADEYDEFFLLYVGKSVFYIIPKKDFTEYEIEAVREINNKSLNIK